MTRRLAMVSTLVLTPWLAPAALAAETTLAPASRWLMDYNVDRCVLSRSFGQAPNDIIVRFIRHAPADQFDLNLIGRALSNQSSSPDLSLRFGETGPFVSGTVLGGRVGGRAAVFTSGRLDNLATITDPRADHLSALAAESTVSSMHLVLGLKKLVLALGPMVKPMQALRACEAELVRSWGLDPTEQAALSSPPQPLAPPASWLSSSDYPDRKLMAGQMAIISFRLMVDPTGSPTGCAVQSNVADDKTFADVTCRAMMRRARFNPARSASGAPVASYFASKVRWIIPDD